MEAVKNIPKGQNVTIARHPVTDVLAQGHAHLLGSEKNFARAQGAGAQKNGLLRLDPHQIFEEVGAERGPFCSMPGKVYDVAFTFGVLLDISDFALAEPEIVNCLGPR